MSSLKVCTKCGIEKSISKFYYRENGKYRNQCIECISQRHKVLRERPGQRELACQRSREWNKNNKAHYRNYIFKKYYGITLDEYEAIHSKQKGLCPICKKSESEVYRKRLYVDHCHETKKIRGLLCSKCNLALGQLNHSVENLQNAAAYLKRSTD